MTTPEIKDVVDDGDGVLKGVVEPTLPAEMLPTATEIVDDPYAAAVRLMINALETIEAAIEDRVALRARTNTEIKTLRDEHDRLTRMKRIAEAAK